MSQNSFQTDNDSFRQSVASMDQYNCVCIINLLVMIPMDSYTSYL